MAIEINLNIKADETIKEILKSLRRKYEIKTKDENLHKNNTDYIEENKNDICSYTEENEEITIEMIKDLTRTKAAEGRRSEIQNILKELESETITGLKKEKYKEFYEKVSKL